MDVDGFWSLMEACRDEVGGRPGLDGEDVAEALRGRVGALPAAEVVAFGRHFADRIAEAGSADLWGAAYLIGGGCAEDAFVDFRCGLVAAGRQWYERATADPDALAAHPAVVEAAEWDDDSAVFADLVGQAVVVAVASVTGEKPDLTAGGYLSGERWDVDDDAQMRHRLPRLSALFLGWPENEGCRC